MEEKNSRDASITLDWGPGTFTFRLAWGQLIELQEATNAGPSYILQQMWEHNWKVQYLSDIIRLGLIGGGETPASALKLVRNYVESRPPMENLTIAQAILAIALTGAPEEATGESKAATNTNE